MSVGTSDNQSLQSGKRHVRHSPAPEISLSLSPTDNAVVNVCRGVCSKPEFIARVCNKSMSSAHLVVPKGFGSGLHRVKSFD